MKKKYLALAFMGLVALSACKDDELVPGNPVMDVQIEHVDALFGDSLPFTINASDAQVPLSTLKARLYYGEEMVSETVIRTKVSGQDYSGKIYVPYMKDIPNGNATLKYILQNINFTIAEKETTLACARPDYPELTLVASDGQEYKMSRTGLYQYEVKGRFPAKLEAYIKAPKMGENGNEICFGQGSDNDIVENSQSYINFQSASGGAYTISFNTLTYEAGPFLEASVNGTPMEVVDGSTLQADLSLTKGQVVSFEGVPDYDSWWIDPDFFTKEADGTLKFAAMSGDYRIMANTQKQYFRVEVLKNGEPATLAEDGTGAIWVIGENVGKPSYSSNAVGWTSENGLCMAPVETGKYQITLVAGAQVNPTAINFKFFHQKGWGGEFTSDKLSTTSDLVVVRSDENGNLALAEGKTFDVNGIYVFTIDVTKGINSAVLDVKKIGEQQAEVKNITLNGQQLTQLSADSYGVSIDLEQDEKLQFTGVSSWDGWYVEPDFFTNNNGEISLNAVSGTYGIQLAFGNKTLSAVRMDGDKEATLTPDGHGALWIMGWGVGHPSMDSQFGWDLATAYAMAEVSPKVYQFTGVAGPEKNSFIGDRFRVDYISCKIYKAREWDTEFTPETSTLESDLLKVAEEGGNLELVSNLEEGTEYVLTVDLTQGNDKAVIKFAKK